ncbi:hypothetical protein AURDEDRAFT_115668 [Auricularia subglabra TFB-10046 SS5]|uniref:Uncharacterized protein n=1 Tax=Auricularia subglabra (strain TFB-10046 / SS5) TaxID=717982 RepID=J0LJY9_AURST|nr:hypothetical protein AURDEDRAFT_115668 [Auricularia subglabra TFB-10046 SS5]
MALVTLVDRGLTRAEDRTWAARLRQATSLAHRISSALALRVNRRMRVLPSASSHWSRSSFDARSLGQARRYVAHGLPEHVDAFARWARGDFDAIRRHSAAQAWFVVAYDCARLALATYVVALSTKAFLVLLFGAVDGRPYCVSVGFATCAEALSARMGSGIYPAYVAFIVGVIVVRTLVPAALVGASYLPGLVCSLLLLIGTLLYALLLVLGAVLLVPVWFLVGLFRNSRRVGPQS